MSNRKMYLLDSFLKKERGGGERRKNYVPEGVSEGGTSDTGADDNDVGSGDVTGAAFSRVEALFLAIFLKSPLLQLSLVVIVSATEGIEKNETK